MRPSETKEFDPPEELQAVTGRSTLYRLEIGDELTIKFFNNQDLNEDAVIRPDGKIALQLIGGIDAAGFSPEQLAENVQKRYTHILKNPAVTVLVKHFAGQRVFLGGELRQPGVVHLDSTTTVLQAIFQAGGCQDTAALNAVVLIRRAQAGRPKIYRLDLEDPINDVFLLPYDLVYVPKSTIASADLFIDQYFDKLIPISRSVGFSYVRDYYYSR